MGEGVGIPEGSPNKLGVNKMLKYGDFLAYFSFWAVVGDRGG